MQPMGDELVTTPNMDATQRGEINDQHQNVAELIMQRDPTMLSTIHQETP
jgi:hypothetical protein